MALVNYSLPYGPGPGAPYYSRSSPLPDLPSHAAINSMLYEPSEHQQPSSATAPRTYVNDPYAPPQGYKQTPNKAYLPTEQSNAHQSQSPSAMFGQSYGSRGHMRYHQQSQQNQQTLQKPVLRHEQKLLRQQNHRQYIPHQHWSEGPTSASDQLGYDYTRQSNSQDRQQAGSSGFNDSLETPIRPDAIRNPAPADVPSDSPKGFTRVDGFTTGPHMSSQPGARTRIHAVLDYDDEFNDYDDENDALKRTGYAGKGLPQQVTPIQGPIFVKNGSVPVVPLYSYPVVNNGTLVQIPILWTALSLALGLEIRGDLVRGVPCVKRFHQLFCPTAGNTYPIDRIELFIDENKALIKRMYGDFQNSGEYGPPQRAEKKKRAAENAKLKHNSTVTADDTGPRPEDEQFGDSYFSTLRNTRQSFRGTTKPKDSGRVDACESKVEIVTPYWASNSAGKIRAVVNTQHFEQAIHQEVCSKVQTNRCAGDCGCEQKYKWHRLLAYDPDNDCKGIFMDWFLFPSCCVCRCTP